MDLARLGAAEGKYYCVQRREVCQLRAGKRRPLAASQSPAPTRCGGECSPCTCQEISDLAVRPQLAETSAD